jgi:predicted transcriptional regulator
VVTVLDQKLALLQTLAEKASKNYLAEAAVGPNQHHHAILMEYRRRISHLERMIREGQDRHVRQLPGLQKTEEEAPPVALCRLPDCVEPVAHDSTLQFCSKHQSNYDSWTKSA